MKVKISLPVILGLAVLVVGGLVLLKGGSDSKPVLNQTALTGGGEVTQPVNGNVENSGSSNDQVREIEVIARQWEFSPNPIVVNFGEKVRLKIKSVDVTHGFALPDFGINEVLNPGQEVVVEFEANKRGTFEFFCSVQCGEGHAGMRGKLIVR